MKRLLFSFLVLILVLSSLSIQAQVPRIINYQGILLGSNEQPVPEGVYKLTFSIYNIEDVVLWTEVHEEVLVVGGVFHILIGGLEPLHLPFNQPYLLGIKVGDDPELTPRMQLTSAAYSLNTDRVQGYEVRQSPTPNMLLPLDANGKIHAGALPTSGGPGGEFIRKNVQDTTSGSTSGDMLRVVNTGSGRGMTVMSSGSHGVYSKSSSDMAGVEGEGSGTGAGVRGSSINHHGTIGYTTATDKAGIYGNSPDGIGVWGNSQNNHGVYGHSTNKRGVKGESPSGGIYGESTQGVGVEGRSNANDGIVGWTNHPERSGVFGNSQFGNGVAGISENRDGILGISRSSDGGHAGVHARNEGNGPAIFAEGDLVVTGAIRGNVGPEGGGSFPRPAYNSGWIEAGAGADFYLGVGLYLPSPKYHRNNFVVDMQMEHSGNPGNWGIGGSAEALIGSAYERGAWYHITSTNSIHVEVGDDEPDWGITRIRIRVWYIN